MPLQGVDGSGDFSGPPTTARTRLASRMGAPTPAGGGIGVTPISRTGPPSRMGAVPQSRMGQNSSVSSRIGTASGDGPARPMTSISAANYTSQISGKMDSCKSKYLFKHFLFCDGKKKKTLLK
jgi:hypothetical protein